jgi:hypothetical protein
MRLTSDDLLFALLGLATALLIIAGGELDTVALARLLGL